jgi:hypothetical protein
MTYKNTAYGVSVWTATYLPVFVTLGNSQPAGAPMPTCGVGSVPIVSGAFSGAIDEFRMYSRELDGQEICKLANPSS